jgi:phosphonate transport system substrate-binding protein
MLRKSLLALVAIFAAVTTTPVAGAVWEDTHKALRVGFLTTNGPAYDLRRLEPFRAYLETSIGFPVELVPAATYGALIDAEATDRVQYAVHSATSYVTAAARCRCIEPLAVPSAFDGAKGFHAILLARADSPIQTAAEAKGMTLAVTAADSIAGRLVPLKYLAREGIDAATHFASVLEATDPAAAIAALLAGNVDLAVGWSSLTGEAAGGYSFGVLTSMVRSGTLSMDAVRIVWRSPLIPFGPHTVRADLPDDLKQRLRSALLSLGASNTVALDAVDRSSVGGGGFVEIAAADYAVVADLIGVSDVADLGGISEPAQDLPALPQPGDQAPAPVRPGADAVTPGAPATP